MKGHGSKFPSKFEEAVLALLTHRKIEDAAAAVGISTKTMKNWMKQPEFEVAKQKAIREMYDQAITRLAQNSNTASGVVLKMIAEPSVPPAVRLKASDSLLDRVSRAIELSDLERRIADVERAASEFKNRGLIM